MGIYGDHVLPRVVDRACGVARLAALRERVCAGLAGRVVELGFGSGHNVPNNPDTVTEVAAVEPSDVAWRLAGSRLRASPVPVERVGLDGQALPLPDASCDAALSTFALCTIPDAAAALREVRRVVAPGGRLHVLEHGLAPDDDARVQRTQRRLEPLQRRLAGGCHLTRRIDDLLVDAGFELEVLHRFYEDGTPRFLGALYLGVARAPG